MAVISLLLFSWISLWAEPLQIPSLASPVMDQANLMKPSERDDLAAMAYEIHTHQGPQITILTLPDLQGYPIEELSIRVAEKWKLGSKEQGNGLLIVISKAERKMRIEVGEGLEGDITDYESNVWIRQILTPSFKAGEFHQGLKLVMLEIAKKFNIKLSKEMGYVRRAPRKKAPAALNIALPFLILFLVLGQLFLSKKKVARGLFTGAGMTGVGFFFIPGLGLGLIIFFILGCLLGIIGLSNLLYLLAASQGRGGYRGGGGFGGGGGWSGGGGGFSGGGSSGGW
jgi:uncharacterized protein